MIYLFDLDDTLVRTSDLALIRTAGVDDDSATYRASLTAALKQGPDRAIWTEKQVEELVKLAPLSSDQENHLGVFTRAPRSYAGVVLQRYFPNIKWSIVVAYEDVRPFFKPHGQGIAIARESLGQNDVFVIGDSDTDIMSAYHAIANVAWDETKKSGKFDYGSYNLLPDFIFSKPDEFLAQMKEPASHTMALEIGSDEVNFDRCVGNGRTVGLFTPSGQVHMIRVFGKHFPRYAPLKGMRACHSLSSEIEAHKEVDEFPDRWVEVIINAAREQLPYFGRKRPFGRVVLTAPPPRPGRFHRLGALISQCEKAYRKRFGDGRVVFEPNLFQFTDGVRSNSNDHLNREERFENVAKHLALSPGATLNVQDTVVVVDDVVTTGSTLIGAKMLLEANGVRYTQLLGISKNISNFMPEKWKNTALYDPN